MIYDEKMPVTVKMMILQEEQRKMIIEKLDSASFFDMFESIKIQVPEGCFMRPMVNFCGSVWRVLIGNDKYIFSIYLDIFDSLGYKGEPYFELYCPEYPEHNPVRFTLGQLDQMNEFLKNVLKI